ncbi:3-oxoacyl-[acyl-carrier-protein] reductase FabG [Cytophagales bacterium WSM2-2]|nr:3-oxoacyl-[acyl-carrier-protein] reductase FabG [Cytophagales bacterium WSM2-2]
MPQSLKGKKIALITGGASGIGLAIATKFVNEGIVTIITGRDQNKLSDAKEALGELCIPVRMDVTKFKQVPGQIEKLAKRFGRIDILVNNAGINLKKELVQVTDEEFERIIMTNLTGVFVISREVAKVMIHQKKGFILNISSMAAQYGLPKVIAYAASKTAIEGMTRSMAVELSPLGILVNCIAPGFIKTNMSSKALDSDPERKKRVLKRTPMGKLGLPEDVANTAYFLVSDQNAYITGTVIPVDGGNSIGF